MDWTVNSSLNNYVYSTEFSQFSFTSLDRPTLEYAAHFLSIDSLNSSFVQDILH